MKINNTPTAYERLIDLYFMDESADKFTDAHSEKVAKYLKKSFGLEVSAEYVREIFTELRVNEIYEGLLFD